MTDPELMHKAASLLARRAHSRGELRAKLLKFGEESRIEPVLDRLRELNLLNDADYAYNSAVRWMRDEGWGVLRVMQMLKRRHISASMADETIRRLGQQVNDGVALEGYLERRFRKQPWPADRKAIRKLFMHLQRRGFREDVIWNLLRQKIPAAAWQQFEIGD